MPEDWGWAPPGSNGGGHQGSTWASLAGAGSGSDRQQQNGSSKAAAGSSNGAWPDVEDVAGELDPEGVPDIVELRPQEVVSTCCHKPPFDCTTALCAPLHLCWPCLDSPYGACAQGRGARALRMHAEPCNGPHHPVLEHASFLASPKGGANCMHAQAAILPLVPRADQIAHCSGNSAVLWQRLGWSLLATLLTLKAAALAAGSFTFPFWYPSLQAGLRNRGARGRYRCAFEGVSLIRQPQLPANA